jgi:hypothetical protein
MNAQQIKAEAKELRIARPDDFPTHSSALEAISRKYGFKDWNTFSAFLKNKEAHK